MVLSGISLLILSGVWCRLYVLVGLFHALWRPRHNAVAELRGGRQGCGPHGGPNSFIFMQFLAKKNRLAHPLWELTPPPPPWKSWIRHCSTTDTDRVLRSELFLCQSFAHTLCVKQRKQPAKNNQSFYSSIYAGCLLVQSLLTVTMLARNILARQISSYEHIAKKAFPTW